MFSAGVGKPRYNPLYEARVRLDANALLCVDNEPRSEWDTLNLFVSSLNKRGSPSDLAASVRLQKHVKTLRTTQGDFKKKMKPNLAMKLALKWGNDIMVDNTLLLLLLDGIHFHGITFSSNWLQECWFNVFPRYSTVCQFPRCRSPCRFRRRRVQDWMSFAGIPWNR